jgi:hypothetical protein
MQKAVGSRQQVVDLDKNGSPQSRFFNGPRTTFFFLPSGFYFLLSAFCLLLSASRANLC